MIRQLEARPDRVPAVPVPASLLDFLAVRLVLDRVAVAHVARSLRGHTRAGSPPTG